MDGGCTSGHGISGSLQLALSSWVFILTLFAFGALTALVLFRGGKNNVSGYSKQNSGPDRFQRGLKGESSWSHVNTLVGSLIADSPPQYPSNLKPLSAMRRVTTARNARKLDSATRVSRR